MIEPAPQPGPGQPLLGRVSGFDTAVGLGVISSDRGDYQFHCTRIADGSRDIAVGTEVSFTVVAGHRGGWEAAAVRV